MTRDHLPLPFKGPKMRHSFKTIALTVLMLPASLAAQSVTLPRVFDPVGNKTSAVGVVVLNGDGTAPAPQGQVQGNSGAGAQDVGNPVKVGGRYSSTTPTLSDGQRGDLALGLRGAAHVQIMGADSPTPIAARGSGSDAISNAVNALSTYSFMSGYDPVAAQWVRLRADTSGLYVVSKGSGAFATGQVSVGTSSTLITVARSLRARITFSIGAANTCAFGNAGVTTTTGFPLQPVAGATLTLENTGAFYAACSATTTISFIEQY